MMNGKVRAFNGDMGMAMSVFKDMVGKVRFVFADPPYKITQARYDKERYGRMRDRRMTMSIFPSRIIIRRSYSQKVLSVD